MCDFIKRMSWGLTGGTKTINRREMVYSLWREKAFSEFQDLKDFSSGGMKTKVGVTREDLAKGMAKLPDPGDCTGGRGESGRQWPSEAWAQS